MAAAGRADPTVPAMTTPSDYTQITYEVEGSTAILTLDRPEQLNVFTGTMLQEMVDAFDRVDADDDVRAVIVTGAGRVFCAGADLSAGGDTFDLDKRAEPPPAARRRGRRATAAGS